MAIDPETLRFGYESLGDFGRDFKFGKHIRRALHNAPTVTLTEIAESSAMVEITEGQMKKYRRREDSDWLDLIHRHQLYEALTNDLDAYPQLVNEAFEIMRVQSDWRYLVAESQRDEAIANTTRHVMEYAGAAADIESPFLDVKYGVQFVRYKEEETGSFRPLVRPIIALVGRIKKIDLAHIAAAPSQPSALDLATIHTLGYDSSEDVRERRAKLHSS